MTRRGNCGIIPMIKSLKGFANGVIKAPGVGLSREMDLDFTSIGRSPIWVEITFEGIDSLADFPVASCDLSGRGLHVDSYTAYIKDLEIRKTSRREEYHLTVVPYNTGNTLNIYTRESLEEETEMSTQPKESGQLQVNRIYKDGKIVTKEENDEEMIEVPPVHPDALMGRIGYSNSYTVNTGNFQSVKIGINIELPCYVTGEQIAEAYQAAKTFVDNRLNQEISELKEYLSKGKS